MSNDAQVLSRSGRSGVSEILDEIRRLRRELDQVRTERDALAAQVALVGEQPAPLLARAVGLGDEPVTLYHMPYDGSHPDM